MAEDIMLRLDKEEAQYLLAKVTDQLRHSAAEGLLWAVRRDLSLAVRLYNLMAEENQAIYAAPSFKGRP